MCSDDVKDQVGSVPGSPGYACQIHQTPIITKRQAAHQKTPQSFRVNQFATLHQNSRPLVHQGGHSNTMHHSPTIGHNLPAAFLTSRPSQQRRDTFTDLTRGTFTDLATPQSLAWHQPGGTKVPPYLNTFPSCNSKPEYLPERETCVVQPRPP